MHFHILMLLGLWISNAIIGCTAMPHPSTTIRNSISKRNHINDDDDYNENVAVALGAPLIIPLEEEIQLEENSEYTINCEDTEPIVWKWPVNVIGPEEKSYIPQDQKRRYGSSLILKDVNYMNVGTYYCVKSSALTKNLDTMDDSELTDLANSNLASHIYIYVNDQENLLAPMAYPITYVIQFQDAVIPCKPSMPNYDVILTTPSGSTYASNTGIRYNPRLGFVMEIRGFEDTGTYICRPKIPAPSNEEEQTEIDIILGNKVKDPSFNKNQLDRPATATDDMELNSYSVEPTETTTTTTLTSPSKLTTKKSSVTNKQMNVTNSISVNLTKQNFTHLVNEVVPAPSAVENRKYTNFENINHNINDSDVIVIQIHLRIIGDGYNTSNNANQTYDNSIEHDDDWGDDNDDDNDGDSDDSTDIIEDLVTESYRQKRNLDLTTRPSIQRTFKDSDPLDNDFNYESFESKLSQHVREIRQVTTRRPSHHYRSTTYTTHVDKPNITSNAKHHAPEGGTFELTCDVKIAHDVKYKVEWVLPDGVQRDETRFIEKSLPNVKVTETHVYGRNILTVKNAKISDSGRYTCNVSDHSSNKAKSSYNMLIVRKGESYIKMRESNDYYTINEKANKTVQMSVRYSGYPWPKLKWYNPNGTEIFNNHKFEITTDDVSSTLKIYNTRLWDTGTYTVEATNTDTTMKREFNVTIEDIPIVMMEDVYVHADEKAHVQCRVQSHQLASVSWVFEPCSIEPRWPSCSKVVIHDFNDTSSGNGATPIEFIYDLYFEPKSPGIIRCSAMNKIGRAVAKSHVLIRDINDNMTIYGVQDHDIIALGDKVTITCAAVAYFFSGDINWYDDKGNLIEGSENIIINKSSTPYSYQKSLTFKSIKDSNQGQYECRARAINHETTESRLINIITHEPTSPRMVNTNLGDSNKIERKLGESVELRCESEAIPKASVVWYKNDELVENNDTDNEAVLLIPYLRPEDQGHYKCVVANRLGSIEETVNIKITNIPGLTLGWIAGILALLLVLIGLVIYLYIRVKRERKLLRELKAAGLANFEEGAVEHINPALTLDEQADLLPYDRGFEFPREKLKLGKQLGAGAFGVVLKAHAEGIKPEEKESVVAVKMVKRQANNEVMRALVSELKIMVHLGQHLNVVNLLGAVTKNIAKRELMVIVEYCRYGNVQNFLMRNRKRFINQINPQTGKIDPSIMTQRFSDNFELNRDGLKYVNLSFSKHQYINHMNNINNMNNYYSMNNRSNSDNDPRSGTRAGRPNSTGYITQSELYEGQVNTCATEQTVMTTVPEGVKRVKEEADDDNNIMSNNSVQPAWRSNYKPDSTEAMTVTTTDLISWAFQVACGMEYLSSKKVLHGDLAARNILLCEDNIVKICDFGLARSMYKSDNYKKQGDAPLPIKWLALESLSDHIFSTYTDVWSYGIVLWELFSLAKVPYPEIDANQSLYLKLKDGYRMEKPPYANDDLYDIMLECWSTNPERRPLFNVLKERFALMLGEEVTNHYVDLNEPYLRVNTEYMKHNPTDYLSLMGSPDEMAPPPPRYVNGHILPEIRIDLSTDDYLTMSPNGDAVIFSPTRPKDSPKTLEDNDDDQPPNISATSFNFPDTAAPQHSPTIVNNLDSPVNKPPRNKKEGIEPLPEEIPMLHNAQHNEDSPEQPRKYTQMLQQTRNAPSPRHHVAETKLQGEGGENYVNIKSPKKFINNNGSKAPDAFSNPSYQILKTGSSGETK
ncbi:vascular endothelial growth factor receptor 1 isoform X1 [Lucilia sericata]|uniref:vascular endothelial growth factor receptor 1 isoform X1 n=1 Tax=Lucilia sericata TaxID=13632 RepID=UPI0018A84466|nr:vascular endothelial growth factor receptor 1 isoform X1 [Lucilia sericata]